MKYTKRWTLGRVVGFQKKPEIEKACKELTNANLGTKAYIAGYQTAVAKVVRDLPEDEEIRYTQMAKEWNKSSPPVEVQRK